MRTAMAILISMELMGCASDSKGGADGGTTPERPKEFAQKCVFADVANLKASEIARQAYLYSFSCELTEESFLKNTEAL